VILVDTSAWVEFDRATGSRVNTRLSQLIGADERLAVSEPIVMEVVAGARDDRRERDLRRLLQRFELLPFDSAVDFDSALRIYRRCRAAGVTPRGMIDCMIAAVAHRNRATVLAHDADLARVAAVIDLELDETSLGAMG
jgi:predicted nucleic acid-binding protein